jgi:hypothetical protein
LLCTSCGRATGERPSHADRDLLVQILDPFARVTKACHAPVYGVNRANVMRVIGFVRLPAKPFGASPLGYIPG